ncbi:hypothetical protein HK098_003689 [Nowakowskiella sp. JEL0407]|nr:hypothetical protein HK098_003689 [Nowakowskiella sp. JEL0407]
MQTQYIDPHDADVENPRTKSLPRNLKPQKMNYSYDAAQVAAAAASAAVSAVFATNTSIGPGGDAIIQYETSLKSHNSLTAPKARKLARKKSEAARNNQNLERNNSHSKQQQRYYEVELKDTDTQTEIVTPEFKSVETQTSETDFNTIASDIEVQLLTLMLANEDEEDFNHQPNSVSTFTRVKMSKVEVHKYQKEIEKDAVAMNNRLDYVNDMILSLIKDGETGLKSTQEFGAKKTNKPKQEKTTNTNVSRKSSSSKRNPSVSRKSVAQNINTSDANLKINTKKPAPSSPQSPRSTAPSPKRSPGTPPPRAFDNRTRTSTPSGLRNSTQISQTTAQARKVKRTSSIMSSDALASAFASIDTSANVEEGLGLDFTMFGESTTPTSSRISTPEPMVIPLVLPDLSWGEISLSSDFLSTIKEDAE